MVHETSSGCTAIPVPRVFAGTASSKRVCSPFLRTAALRLYSAITACAYGLRFWSCLTLPGTAPKQVHRHLYSKHAKTLPSHFLIAAWGFTANQQRKKARKPFQVHSAHWKWKPVREQVHWNVDMVQWSQCYALFLPFFYWNVVVLYKSLPASLLKNSWFCFYVHMKHPVLKQNLFLSYQYLQASKLIELKAQSMSLMASSAGSCAILASGQKKHQYKRNPINSECNWCSQNGPFGEEDQHESMDLGMQGAASGKVIALKRISSRNYVSF